MSTYVIDYECNLEREMNAASRHRPTVSPDLIRAWASSFWWCGWPGGVQKNSLAPGQARGDGVESRKQIGLCVGEHADKSDFNPQNP